MTDTYVSVQHAVIHIGRLQLALKIVREFSVRGACTPPRLAERLTEHDEDGVIYSEDAVFDALRLLGEEGYVAIGLAWR